MRKQGTGVGCARLLSAQRQSVTASQQALLQICDECRRGALTPRSAQRRQNIVRQTSHATRMLSPSRPNRMPRGLELEEIADRVNALGPVALPVDLFAAE